MKRIHEHKYELEGEQHHLLLLDGEVYPDAQSRGGHHQQLLQWEEFFTSTTQ